MRYCIYESRRNNSHCVVEGQCATCAAYQRGDFPPHFLPPAIPRLVSYGSDYVGIHMLRYYRTGQRNRDGKSYWKQVYGYCDTDHEGTYEMVVPLYPYLYLNVNTTYRV